MIGINSESEFENQIRNIINADIIQHNPDLIVLDNKKAVDIMICRNNFNPTIFFIEIKYHQNNHGRLGFGHGKGGGFQPEILTKRPQIFESNLRWIIGSQDSEDYYFFDNEELLLYMQGGQVAEKFNGIQKRIFRDAVAHSKIELSQKLKLWLAS